MAGGIVAGQGWIGKRTWRRAPLENAPAVLENAALENAVLEAVHERLEHAGEWRRVYGHDGKGITCYLTS